MVLDHAVDLAVAGERKLQPEAEAVQRRAPGAQVPHARRGHAQAARLVVELGRLERDVVAEPLGLLVGVGVAAHADQQGGVVDDRPLVLVETDALGQAQGDQALAEHVLHRLAEPEIDPE